MEYKLSPLKWPLLTRVSFINCSITLLTFRLNNWTCIRIFFIILGKGLYTQNSKIWMTDWYVPLNLQIQKPLHGTLYHKKSWSKHLALFLWPIWVESSLDAIQVEKHWFRELPYDWLGRPSRWRTCIKSIWTNSSVKRCFHLKHTWVRAIQNMSPKSHEEAPTNETCQLTFVYSVLPHVNKI